MGEGELLDIRRNHNGVSIRVMRNGIALALSLACKQPAWAAPLTQLYQYRIVLTLFPPPNWKYHNPQANAPNSKKCELRLDLIDVVELESELGLGLVVMG